MNSELFVPYKWTAYVQQSIFFSDMVSLNIVRIKIGHNYPVLLIGVVLRLMLKISTCSTVLFVPYKWTAHVQNSIIFFWHGPSDIVRIKVVVLFCFADRTFGVSCDEVKTKIKAQITAWTSADNCANGGEKCLYTVSQRNWPIN